MASQPPLDIEPLYERHAENLLVFFTRRTFDPEVATDLWAETFAQALAGRGKYRGSSDEEAAGWLYRIAHRQLAGYWRKGGVERRKHQKLQLERPVLTDDASAALMRRAGLDELRGELAVALSTLSDDTRQAIDLRVVQELSYPEVAKHLNTSEQNARARVSRGLKALGGLLDQERAMEVAS